MTDQYIKGCLWLEIMDMMKERHLTFAEAKQFVWRSYYDDHIRALVNEL